MTNQLHDQAVLSLAAYAALSRGRTIDQTDDLQDQEFTSTQAAQFAARFPTVVTSLSDPGSGFQVAVFKDTLDELPGNMMVAFRGTTIPEDLSAGADILGAGAGYDQIVAMTNWWRRASGPKDSLVPQFRLATYALGAVPSNAVVLRLSIDSAFVLEATDSITATGELNQALGSDPDGRVDVTGHSLGGHLAMAFSSLFASRTGQVTVFNAPGFLNSTANQNFFTNLGGSIPTGAIPLGSIVNVAADEALAGSSPFGFIARMHSQPGTLIDIAIEKQSNSDEQDPFLPALNHSSVALADSLAIYSLLNDLDPALTPENYKAILNRVAQGAAGSYEKAVDALQALFKVEPALLPVGNNNREALYEAIYALRDTEKSQYFLYQGLLEFSPLPTDAATLITESSSNDPEGLAHRYALNALDPFVVQGIASGALLATHNEQGQLNLFDQTTGTGALTAQWLQDRADFLERKLHINSLDLESSYQNSANANPDPTPGSPAYGYQMEARRYEDRATGFVATSGPNPNSLQHIIFGTEGVDVIHGPVNGREDWLYGGAGADFLAGHYANDYLEGGAGFDVYQFFTGNAVDTVLDTDGRGLLVRNGAPLALGVKISADVWQLGGTTYTRNGADLEVAFAGNSNDRIRVPDFDFAKAAQNGYMAVRLFEESVASATSLEILGDREFREYTVDVPAEPGGGFPDDFVYSPDWLDAITEVKDLTQVGTNPNTGEPIYEVATYTVTYHQYDARQNVERSDEVFLNFPDEFFDSALNDHIVAGGGQDRVDGTRGGNDRVDVGAGRDRVLAGAGADWVEGGANGDTDDGGGDLLEGGTGNDTLFGDSAKPIAQAIAEGELGGSSTERGEYINGGADNDIVVGGEKTDALFGAGGADLLIGGAGNDFLNGDLDYLLREETTSDKPFEWQVQFEVNEASRQDIYLGFVGSEAVDPGADLLYGGAGNDVASGGGGNDYIELGAGEDWGYGDAGDDILLGGAEKDVLVGDREDLAAAQQGDDYIDGGGDGDFLFGYGGADILIGGQGEDQLQGGEGNDVLFGGADTDALLGGAGKDTYVYYKGDGQDIVIDPDIGAGSQYLSSLVLGPDIKKSDVKFRLGSLVVDLGEGDEIRFEDFNHEDPHSTRVLDTIQFADGDVMTFDDILAQGFVLEGTAGDDGLIGTSLNEHLEAGEGNDYLYGGAGNDTLSGGAGIDTYFVRAGLNADIVTDGEGGEGNVLLLGAGVTLQGLATRRADDSLVLTLRGTEDSLTITDYYARPQAWTVRDVLGAETSLEAVIAQPDPYDGDFLAQLWGDLKFGATANMMARAYDIGWTALDHDTFEMHQEQANLEYSRQTTVTTLLRADPPFGVLNTSTWELEQETIRSFGLHSNSTFRWALQSLESARVESDAAVVTGGLGGQGIVESTGEAMLTLQRSGHISGEQLSTWTTSGGVISFDTGTETVVAIIRHDNELHSYRQSADVVYVSPGVGTWPHDTDAVVGDKALVDMVRMEHRHIGVLELIGGESANQFSISGETTTFDTTLLIDAGAGDDLVMGGHLVFGNDGNDDLSGGAVLIGGNGDDTLEASRNARFVFTASESGIDTITARKSAGAAYVDWYYDSIGMSDWRERLDEGGRYAARIVVDAESSVTEYFDTLEEAEAEGGTSIRLVEPLDSFAPVVRRDDAATLNVLAAQAGLSRDIALFGPGLTLEDLDLTINVFGTAAESHPDQPWHAGGRLSIRWNDGSAGFDVEVPDVNYGFTGTNLISDGWEAYRIGEGLEAFEFVDGGVHDLEQVLQRATVVFDYGYEFLRGSGSQVIEPLWRGVNFVGDISSEEISAYRDEVDLVLVLADGSAQATIPGWFADPLAFAGWVLHFSDGTNLNAAATTEIALTRRGTEAADVLVGDPTMTSRLFGYGGDDTLVGGAGDDYLDGGEGTDTYLLRAGSGADVISDAGPSVLVFDESVPSWSISFSLGSLLLHYGDGESVRFTAFDADDPHSTPVFERLEFADGTTYGYADFLENSFQHYGSDEDDVLAGTGIRDAIFGEGGDDTLNGRGGNDDLYGGEGDDTLWGGAGDADLMSGGEGADTYLYAVGDGRDEIYEWSETQDGTDRVVLLGFEFADVAVTRDLWNYYLVMAGGDRLTLGDMLVDPTAVVEQVELADGTVWSPQDLEARVVLLAATEGEDILWGTSSADSILGLGGFDTLYGNAGDDFLAGGEGEDTYYFVAGDGADAIDNLDTDGSPDYLVLAGAASTDAALVRSGADLVLQLAADSVRLIGWYADADRRIDYMAFGTDGAQWDAATIEALAPADGENSAPEVANPLVDRSFEAGSALEFLVPIDAFHDANGDALELSASLYGDSALPAWLAFDPATGIFSGSPLASHIGISHIAVTATDPEGESAVSDFGLIVRAAAGSTVTGTAGNEHLYGGTGDETLIARGGSDYVYGDIGNDLLRGGAGTDVLQGGAGSDVLRGGAGQNVLDGGAGDDLIYGGAGSGFIVGGAGNDTLRVGQGSDVIAFNAGDGMDTVYGGRDGGNTLSFGGSIRYSDIQLSRSGKDLVVSTGEDEGVTLKNWYGGNHSVLSLQVVLDATEEFDASSGDPLYNRRVQTFDFLGMVGAYDAARAATPGLTNWEVTNALLAFHLGGADDAAIGGDLAYWYGRNRTLQGISVASAQQVIGAAGFGSEAQSLRPFSGLQEGFAKLV